MGGKFQITDVGLICKEFSKTKLIELCLDKSGVQTGPFGSLLHKKDYVEVGTPIITVEHLGDNVIEIGPETPKVSDADRERLIKFQLMEGDIVFSRVGSVDRRAYVSSNENGWLFSGRCLRVRVDKNKINPKYLSYFFGFEGFKKYIRGIAVGATMPSINTKILSEIDVYYPSYNQQTTIVKYLSAIEQKIQVCRNTNKTLEQMAQALFKSWFVDFDPVIDNALAAGNSIPDELQERAELRQQVIAERTTNPKLKPLPDDIQHLFPSEFEESELGWIPKGWESLSIHDLVDSVSITYKLKEVDEVIFLNTGDIEDGKLLHKNYSKTEGLPGQAKKSIVKGDILYSEIRPKNKRFALVNIDCSDYVVSTKLMVLRAKVGIDSLLPYFILTQEKTIQNLQHVAEHRSGTFPQITFKELADVTTTLPKANMLVDYFVFNYLKPFYDKQFSSVTQNDQLEKLRDTLLPKLISGELKINRDVA
ncbi:MAG: type I restriction enzyme S subunit [Paraglaciecola sp.]|jgi:type I restriction enzyme S subunit